MFQFGRFPSYTYFIQYMMYKVCLYGLLHSDICGSLYACYSPQLSAAYHVLRRLSMPRHSPYALCALPFELCASLFSIQNCYPTIFFFQKISRFPHLHLLFFIIQFSSSLHVGSRFTLAKCRKIHFIDFVAENHEFFPHFI